MITIVAGLAICVPAFATTAVAPAASDPTAAQYGGDASGNPGGVGAANAQGSAASSQSPGSTGLDSRIGSLPFTGLDLIALLAIAAALLATGFALHRLSRPHPGS
jgi:hypothetical protein